MWPAWYRILAGAGVLLGMVTAPASAAVAPPHAVSALFRTAGVEAEGYAPAQALTVEVLRGAAATPIGHAAGTTIADPRDPALGFLEVNPGACWEGSTPEIVPGDTVRVTGPDFADTMVVQDVTVEPPVAAGDAVTVTGVARTPSGEAVDPQGLEVRIRARDKFSNGSNKLRAGAGRSDGTIAYDAPSRTYVATFPGLNAADRAAALDPELTRGEWSSADEAETTIAENPPLTGAPPFGPVPPCTAPLARNAITGADHAHTVAGRPTVNLANAASDLVLGGAANPDVTAVTVTLGARMYAGVLGAAGRWAATVPAADLAALPEGVSTATGRFTTATGDAGGTDLAIVKDTVAPPAPSATPAPGTFPAAQSVALAVADPLAIVHFTADGSAPTAASRVYAQPLPVGTTLTLRAIAVDDTGNVGPEAQFAYVVAPPAAALTAPLRGVRVTSLRVPARVSLHALRAHGLTVRLRTTPGSRLVRFMLLRRVHGRVVPGRTVLRVLERSGVVRVRLRAGELGLRRPGAYVLRAEPAMSGAMFDERGAREVALRVVGSRA